MAPNFDSKASGELDPLLAHAGYVQRLARSLVSDAHDAEDLAQETWLSALSSSWRREGAPRAFLAGVLRRRALQAHRDEGRRRDREALVEPREPACAASVSEALERAELGRELARLAVELEEPFRSVLLLRYFAQRSSAAIAAELGLPRKTVESRLARGHARLRERWLRAHPEQAPGREQLPGLALLAGSASLRGTTVGGATCASIPLSTSVLSPALGALLVNTKLALAVLVLLGGGLAWLAVSLTSERHGALPVARGAAAQQPAGPESALPSSAPLERRLAAATDLVV